MRIAGWSGNPEHLAAMGRINDRLRSIRIVEALLLDDVQGELRELEHATALGRPILRKRLARYHRRRSRAAAEIVEAIHHR